MIQLLLGSEKPLLVGSLLRPYGSLFGVIHVPVRVAYTRLMRMYEIHDNNEYDGS